MSAFTVKGSKHLDLTQDDKDGLYNNKKVIYPSYADPKYFLKQEFDQSVYSLKLT